MQPCVEEQSSERGKEGAQWSGRGRVVVSKESGKPARGDRKQESKGQR